MNTDKSTIRLAKRDRYALILLGKHEPDGERTVLRDALAAWVEHHPTAPTYQLIEGDVDIAVDVGDDVLALFDAAVGGAGRRMEFMPTAIAEWVRRGEFAPIVGEIPDDLDAAIERATA